VSFYPSGCGCPPKLCCRLHPCAALDFPSWPFAFPPTSLLLRVRSLPPPRCHYTHGYHTTPHHTTVVYPSAAREFYFSTVRCAPDTAHCTRYTAHCTRYTVHGTRYTVVHRGPIFDRRNSLTRHIGENRTSTWVSLRYSPDTIFLFRSLRRNPAPAFPPDSRFVQDDWLSVGDRRSPPPPPILICSSCGRCPQGGQHVPWWSSRALFAMCRFVDA
jgi:hypothetical protein